MNRQNTLFLSSFLTAAVSMALYIPSAQAESDKPWKEGRLLVQARSGLGDSDLSELVKQHGGKALGRLRQLNVHVIQVPPQAEDAVARALSKNPRIAFAEKDMLVELTESTPNDPNFSSAWHLPKIQAPLAWDNSRGDGIVIAILDSGVNGGHPDLSAKMVSGWNSVSANTETGDINGHGTAVAGTAAASTDNGTGISSIAWNAAIMPVRITNRSDGWAYFSDIANGLTWAADNGAHVANISYNVTNSSSITSAAQYMRNQGGVVVVAAGNDGQDPGYSDNSYLISVSATTSSDAKASWSNFGSFVDVAAPGSGILTTNNGGGYGSWSGTSFASPATAGVVALIMAANPNLTPEEVEQVLEQSADNVAGSETHIYFGDGRVNAAAAVQLAQTIESVDLDPPSVTLFSPVNNATVEGEVLVEVNAVDPGGISEVVLMAEGVQIGVDSVAPYQFAWNSTAHEDGTAQLIAYAYDASGNEGSAAVMVTVDNVPDPSDETAPDVGFTNLADGAVVSKTVNIQLSAVDDVAVTFLKLYINDALKGVASSGVLNYSWNTRKETDGIQVLRAVAADAQGNQSETVISVTKGASNTDTDSGKTNPGKGRKK